MAPVRIDMDFAQIESRVAALISNKMVDLHTERAAKEFGVPVSEVTPSMRQVAKQLNYYDLYGPEDDERRTKIDGNI